MAGNAQVIIDLDRKRMDAMAKKDVATLNALLADDLVYCHSSARLDTKQSLIGAMESGATVYTAVEPSEVKAQDLGDAVVLTGVAQIKVTSNGTPLVFWRAVHRRVRQQGRALADGDLAVDAPAGSDLGSADAVGACRATDPAIASLARDLLRMPYGAPPAGDPSLRSGMTHSVQVRAQASAVRRPWRASSHQPIAALAMFQAMPLMKAAR
jgi:hypothetical protein